MISAIAESQNRDEGSAVKCALPQSKPFLDLSLFNLGSCCTVTVQLVSLLLLSTIGFM